MCNDWTMRFESITADRRRLKADIASLHFEFEQSHRSRREVEKRADRLQMELDDANIVNQSLQVKIHLLNMDFVTVNSIARIVMALLHAKLVRLSDTKAKSRLHRATSEVRDTVTTKHNIQYNNTIEQCL